MPDEKIPRRYRGIPQANWPIVDLVVEGYRRGMSYGDYVALVDPPPQLKPHLPKKKRPPRD